eukprot:CAMPEP_0194541858 /NCGR_PEP_ID=MMETSP0253-20130528/82956_1 /TAXON_ID=2966 /ORGANISM="Noctiluca scintillans" /LENGTH=797 /DNA_ID=CAMNT_0039388407 /DNA_START=1 /DNA_END=2391 /DNA_ORIENTATION=+
MSGGPGPPPVPTGRSYAELFLTDSEDEAPRSTIPNQPPPSLPPVVPPPVLPPTVTPLRCEGTTPLAAEKPPARRVPGKRKLPWATSGEPSLPASTARGDDVTEPAFTLGGEATGVADVTLCNENHSLAVSSSAVREPAVGDSLLPGWTPRSRHGTSEEIRGGAEVSSAHPTREPARTPPRGRPSAPVLESTAPRHSADGERASAQWEFMVGGSFVSYDEACHSLLEKHYAAFRSQGGRCVFSVPHRGGVVEVDFAAMQQDRNGEKTAIRRHVVRDSVLDTSTLPGARATDNPRGHVDARRVPVPGSSAPVRARDTVAASKGEAAESRQNFVWELDLGNGFEPYDDACQRIIERHFCSFQETGRRVALIPARGGAVSVDFSTMQQEHEGKRGRIRRVARGSGASSARVEDVERRPAAPPVGTRGAPWHMSVEEALAVADALPPHGGTGVAPHVRPRSGHPPVRDTPSSEARSGHPVVPTRGAPSVPMRAAPPTASLHRAPPGASTIGALPIATASMRGHPLGARGESRADAKDHHKRPAVLDVELPTKRPRMEGSAGRGGEHAPESSEATFVWEFAIHDGFQAYDSEHQASVEKQFRAYKSGGGRVGRLAVKDTVFLIDFKAMSQQSEAGGRRREVRRRECAAVVPATGLGDARPLPETSATPDHRSGWTGGSAALTEPDHRSGWTGSAERTEPDRKPGWAAASSARPEAERSGWAAGSAARTETEHQSSSARGAGGSRELSAVWEFSASGSFKPYDPECQAPLEMQYQDYLGGGSKSGSVTSRGVKILIDFGSMNQR